ncbi:hypothetical protein [Legionella rowbothamii]|uniref:hypothetical protein n=1 Tax=Legionella rowbothamii TaxID=96229 RepID=UPI0010554A7D|nr:hypothetical protein [Legionella rowbothamii]
MAIKKGAFELYTQERKLPEKRVKSPAKASHFFDDIYTKDNGSQLVHEQSLIQQTTPAGSPSAHANPVLNNNTSNGSQLVHEQSLIQQAVPAGSPSAHAKPVLNNNTSKGSQSVHEQSIVQQTAPAGSPSAHANPVLNNNTNNGSQSVHEQSIIQQAVPIGSPSAHANPVLNNNTSNGSQSVHDQSLIQQTVPVGSPSAHANSGLNNNTSNGSQSVHDQSLIQQTVPVGSPSAHANSVLNNNTNNGSQSVHVKVNDLASKTVDAQVSVLEKNPQISFSKLVGNQRAIIIALYKNIKINKSDTTDELTLESISKLTQVNQKSLKNTLFRLNNAGILIRADQKVGRGGWVKYKINTHIIREIQQKEFFR